MYKRKSPYQGKRLPQRKYARRGTVATYNKGYVRTSGFYGRYNRASVKSSSVSELKYKDTAITGGPTTTPLVMPASGTLVEVPVGTGPSERIGRQIRVKSVGCYLTLVKAAGTYATDVIRLMLVLDTQCNGAKATGASVLETNDLNSFRNMANSKRFVVLKDSEISITSTTWNGTTFAAITRQLEFFRKVNYPIEYDQTLNTGAVTTIRSNNLFILAVAKYGSVSIDGTIRVRYDD